MAFPPEWRFSLKPFCVCRTGDNAARNLRRRFVKFSHWPQLYTAEIRTISPKTGAERLQEISFLLPHELIDALVRHGDERVVFQRGGLDPQSLRHLQDVQAQVNEQVIPLGIWGDGVPCNWDRSGSVDCVAMSLPGLLGKAHNMRLPLTVLNHQDVCYHTWCYFPVFFTVVIMCTRVSF